MGLRFASGADWARETSAAGSVKLARLEAHVLQTHPEIVADMGADGAAIAAHLARVASRNRVWDGFAWTVGLAFVLLVASPIIGMSAILGDVWGINRMPIESSGPVAGVCFVIAAVVQLAVLGWWLRRRERCALWLAVSGGTVLFGGIAIWAGDVLDSREGSASWSGWVTAIGVGMACALGSFAVQLLLGRRRTQPPPSQTARQAATDAAIGAPAGSTVDDASGIALAGAVRRHVARLDAAERTALLADRQEALTVLHRRGLIDDDLHDRAQASELGLLFLLDEARPAED